MTLRTSARTAGVAFLLYIVAGISSTAIYPRAASGGGVAARLIAIGAHPSTMGVIVLLGFVQSFCAIVLAVTLFALTRGEDRDVASLAMVCRVIEGTIGGLSILTTTAVISLATNADAQDAAGVRVLGAYLFHNDVAVTATFFAVGSLLFAILFLRGRLIPVVLAWLGVAASLLLVVWLPLQAARFLPGAFAVWIPMLVFELWLAFQLILKGVAAPSEPH